MKRLSKAAKERQRRIMNSRLIQAARVKKRGTKSRGYTEHIEWSHSSIVKECLHRLRGKQSFEDLIKNRVLRLGVLKVPEVFSFIDDPEEVDRAPDLGRNYPKDV